MPTMLPKAIGVISSITSDAFRDLFETAVNKTSDNASIQYFDQVGYDGQLLQNALDNFNADSAIGVIVTFGGMIAWYAANQRPKKPFISLVGSSDLPVTANANCFGGVSLETYAYNQPKFGAVTFTANGASVTDTTNFLAAGDRVAFSTSTAAGAALPTNISAIMSYQVLAVTPGTPNTFTLLNVANTGASAGSGVIAWAKPNRVAFMCSKYAAQLTQGGGDISLLYHSASLLAVKELMAWQGMTLVTGGVSGPPPAVQGIGGGAPGPAVPLNVRKGLINAFDNINTPAVIISADPFFQDNKEALIQAANASNKIVCYPLRNYLTGKLATTRSMVYGPSLHKAIEKMGELAGSIWAGTITTPPSPLFPPADYPRRPRYI